MAELIQCLFIVALGGIVWNLRRDASPSPLALWTWAWVVIVTVSIFVYQYQAPEPAGAFSKLFFPLFPAFILAGALAFSDRVVPRWLLPTAIGVGVSRALLAIAGMPSADYTVALLTEPTVIFVAAALVFQAPVLNAKRTKTVLGVLLTAIGAIQMVVAVDGIQGQYPASLLAWSWTLLGPLTMATQWLACAERNRSRRELSQNERQQVQRALQESEARFEALTENSSHLILETDSQGRIQYTNPQVGELLGISKAALLGMSVEEILRPEDRAWSGERSTPSNSMRTARDTKLWRHSEGHWLWIESTIRSFLAANGSPRWVISATDVTERRSMQKKLEAYNERLEEHIRQRTSELNEVVEQLKNEIGERQLAETALRESEHRYRMISELSSDWSFQFRVNFKGRMSAEWITDSLVHVTGFSRERLLEIGYFALVHSEDRKALQEEAQRTFVAVAGKSRRRWETEHRIVTAGGQTRWVQVQLEIDPADDQSLQVIGAARDITERRAGEEERRRLEDHLRDVQRLESLGVLADRIAHDFNNQLTVILGNSSLALAEVGGETALQERLQRIRAAAQHSASLTEQMLTYAGKASAALKTIHLPHLLEGMQELLEASISRQCQLDLSPFEALPLIEGDEGQLRQVVVNLVTNASEAMDRRPGTIRIRTGLSQADHAYLSDTFGPADLPEGEYVYLEVRDDGSGISSSDRGRIFEPFYTTRFSGRGLGLAAVLGIVSRHRGAIKLDSGEGLGTTIRALFPSMKLLEATRPKKPMSHEPSHILVIDDDEAVQELLTEIFQRAGYRVTTADNELNALKLMGQMQEEVGVVLLDADTLGSLPGRTIEKLQEFDPRVPVVLSTGFAPENVLKQLGGQEIAGIVSMPFDEAQLVEVIEVALNQNKDPSER